jgi:anaerobic magnesium-protoporphyrin IX monomethyl ester cyclase
MASARRNPLILLYNPRVASPGYHRLPASLLQLAVHLEPHYPYVLVDGNLDQGRDRAGEIMAQVQSRGVRYLGVTIMPGPQLQQAIPDLKRIKAACPQLPIIVGGFFPTFHPQTCALDAAIDYVVVGPGEQTLPELLAALEAGRDPGDVPGLAFERHGRVIQTPQRSPSHPDNLPRLPYHKVPMERYVVKTFLGTRTLSHHSSFGCPFHCNFCAVAKIAAGKWLAEDAIRVAELADFLVKRWQINALELHDNNFFVNETRVTAFCEELLRRGLKLNWWAQGRIDTLWGFSTQTWKLMQASGLKMVFMGAESGDHRALRHMNKGGTLTPVQTLELAALMREYGIIPEFSFIVGNPGDSGADIERSLEFIRKIKLIHPNAEIILYRYDPVPFEGQMWQDAVAQGFRFPQTLSEWAQPYWARLQRRRRADLPWFSKRDQLLVRDFETVLNAYYPSATDHRFQDGPWRPLLKVLSTWRYRWRCYRWPLELRTLQKLIHYQRPETSGF